MPIKLEIDFHSDAILFARHYFYFCAFFAVLQLRYELAKPEQLGELVDEAEHLQQVLQPQAEGVEPPEDVLLTEAELSQLPSHLPVLHLVVGISAKGGRLLQRATESALVLIICINKLRKRCTYNFLSFA